MLHAILEDEARSGGGWNSSSYFIGSHGPQVGWTQGVGPSFDWYYDSESGNYINRNTRERINPLTNYRDYQETIEPYLASNYTIETYIPRWSVGTSAIMPDGSTYRGYQEFMGWEKTASNSGGDYLSSAPEQYFSGFWGGLKYFWTGGNVDGYFSATWFFLSS